MNRFALFATGLVAASASAAPIEINVLLDRWAGEAGIEVYNSANSLIGSMFVSSGYIYVSGALSLAAFSGNSKLHPPHTTWFLAVTWLLVITPSF